MLKRDKKLRVVTESRMRANGGLSQIDFTVFGLVMRLTSDFIVPDFIRERILPPFSHCCSSQVRVDVNLFWISTGSEDVNGFYFEDERIAPFREFVDDYIDGIEFKIQSIIASKLAGNYLFFHASAVSIDGSGILFPGKSYSGKSTLARSCLDLGASYFAEDCCVVDFTGRLHSYPTALKIRNGNRHKTHFPLNSTNLVDVKPIPVNLIVFAQYDSTAKVQFEELRKGKAMQMMLQNLFYPPSLAENPEGGLRALNSLIDRAKMIKTCRGEASDFVKELIVKFID